MFGLFKKKSPTVMDGMIRMVYRANPPPKSADLERSITIAHEDLLFEKVEQLDWLSENVLGPQRTDTKTV
jgi:hypothetical protein